MILGVVLSALPRNFAAAMGVLVALSAERRGLNNRNELVQSLQV